MIISQNTPFHHQPSDGWGEKGCPEKIKKFLRLLRRRRRSKLRWDLPDVSIGVRKTYRQRLIVSSPPFLESRVRWREIDGGPWWQIVNFNSKFFVRKLNSHEAKRGFKATTCVNDEKGLHGCDPTAWCRKYLRHNFCKSLRLRVEAGKNINFRLRFIANVIRDRADTFVRRIISRVWVVGWGRKLRSWFAA